MKFSQIALSSLIVLVLVAVLFPVFAQQKPGKKIGCYSRLRQIHVALKIYGSDNDDHFPNRDRWVDDLYPYAKDCRHFHCPNLKDAQWGYAFNAALSEKVAPAKPVPLVYDSVNPMKNASDLVTSFPNVAPRNMMVMSDGSVKSTKK